MHVFRASREQLMTSLTQFLVIRSIVSATPGNPSRLPGMSFPEVLECSEFPTGRCFAKGNFARLRHSDFLIDYGPLMIDLSGLQASKRFSIDPYPRATVEATLSGLGYFSPSGCRTGTTAKTPAPRRCSGAPVVSSWLQATFITSRS
jgi:hypothetical protein